MDTLVLHSNEPVNNPNLRGLNEIRFKVKKRGDGSGFLKVGAIRDEAVTGAVKMKVINGSGHFTSTTGGTNYGAEVTYGGNVWYRFYLDSAEAEISFTNFMIYGTELGSNNTPFVLSSDYGDNSPELVLNLNELKNTSISQIRTYSTAKVNGDIKSLVNTGITKIGILYASSYDNSEFAFTLEELIAVPTLTKIEATHAKFNGGNIYELLKAKSSLDMVIGSSLTDGTIRCDYVNGMTIPECAISRIGMTGNAATPLDDVISFLNLLIDGVNANKISVSGTISVPATSAVATNETVVALKNTLTGLGVTITVGS